MNVQDQSTKVYWMCQSSSPVLRIQKNEQIQRFMSISLNCQIMKAV